ncbi:MFS transporter [Antrihabitans stalactiti]|uniref:MFS transporter n=1 Tax=Antrihabitans stalactiti TaxID=2584121 RepID=A0A848KCC0_9NOCA|nr:MFS transporter [Antrihabitans stalactiti]
MHELIPFYALYAILFADHGLDAAQISSLLVIWSLTSFVLEVPSGAWADTVSRRGLLVLGALLTGAGFAAWTVFPSYLGFAIGFVLWGTGGALDSGTFEALLYDELTARSAARDYARVMGYARSAAEFGALLGILAATPLFAWGGYGLVGWVSVAVCGVAASLAWSLPPAAKAASVAAVADLEDDADAVPILDEHRSPLHTYVSMLRTGIAEVVERPTVRWGVLLASMLFGFTAFDEYFGLLAEENGASTQTIPLLVGLTVAGTLIGSALAGRTAKMRSATMAWALVVAAVALAVGALTGGAGVVGVAGFAAIGVGYGIISNAVVVTEARLQDSIEGPARATVTSVSGLLSEVVALAVFGAVALGSVWLPISVNVALLAVPVLLTAVLVPKWLPATHSDPDEVAEVAG